MERIPFIFQVLVVLVKTLSRRKGKERNNVKNETSKDIKCNYVGQSVLRRNKTICNATKQNTPKFAPDCCRAHHPLECHMS